MPSRASATPAGTVLSTLPALLLLMLGQRDIVRGLTAGALE
ncbi:MAG: hypothetical protein ACREGK_10450 [Geminicoccales bacterium]